MKGAPYCDEYLSSAARHFHLDVARLRRVLAYLEAWKNIRRYVNPDVTIQLMEGSFDQPIMDAVKPNLKHCALEDLCPIAMSPYVSEGLNLRRLFLPHTL